MMSVFHKYLQDGTNLMTSENQRIFFHLANFTQITNIFLKLRKAYPIALKYKN